MLPYNFFERVIYEIDLKNTFPDDFSPPIVLYEPELSGSFYFTMLHPSNQSLANKIPDYAHFDTLGTPTTGGATYNISKDGFFQLHGATLTTSASIFYRIRINNVIIEEGYTVNMRYGYYTSPLFPVLKNDIVKVEVDTNVAGVNYAAKLYHAR